MHTIFALLLARAFNKNCPSRPLAFDFVFWSSTVRSIVKKILFTSVTSASPNVHKVSWLLGEAIIESVNIYVNQQINSQLTEIYTYKLFCEVKMCKKIYKKRKHLCHCLQSMCQAVLWDNWQAVDFVENLWNLLTSNLNLILYYCSSLTK